MIPRLRTLHHYSTGSSCDMTATVPCSRKLPYTASGDTGIH